MTRWDTLLTWFETNEILIGWMGLFSLIMFLGTLIAIPLIVIALPSDFLVREDKKIGRQLLNVWYIPYWIMKNLFGAVLVAAGVAMLVLPGQGLLTILIGLALITFPGKRLLIYRILCFKRVILVINSLRVKFGKEPVILPHGEPSCLPE
jgi:hypothetical protein